jgi:peroxiredoxin
MKRTVILTLIILAGAAVCLAQENPGKEITAVREKAERLFKEGKIAEYIEWLDAALLKFPADCPHILQAQVQALDDPGIDEKTMAAYCEFLDTALTKLPACRLDILQAQVRALDKLNLARKALRVAEAIDKLLPEGGEKVISAAELAWRHITCNDIERSFTWAKISADRGYQNFNYFLKNKEFKPLQDDQRFQALIKQIKHNAGVGEPAKQFVRLDVSGKEVSLAKVRGKVVLLDFWATWCPPCVAEMPGLQKLYAEFKGKGFEIIAVSADSDRKRLDDFLSEKKLPWPMIGDGKGWDDETRKLYHVAALPACFLIDRKGILQYNQLKGEALRNAVAELVKE